MMLKTKSDIVSQFRFELNQTEQIDGFMKMKSAITDRFHADVD